jgi:cyclin-dependent kinase regulatory subunit CKS1
VRRDPTPHVRLFNRRSRRRIHYSERYSDDEFEYRHVILPKPLLKLIPKQYFCPDDSGVLRLLSENEWRGIGITQSLGWVHYEVHGPSYHPLHRGSSDSEQPAAPEPHVLLFRRAKNFDAQQAQDQMLLEQAAAQAGNGKGAAKARKK